MLKKLVCGSTLWDNTIFEPVIRSNGDNSNGWDAANLHSLSHRELERNFSHITSIPSANKTFLRLWQQDPGFDLILGRFAASFFSVPSSLQSFFPENRSLFVFLSSVLL